MGYHVGLGQQNIFVGFNGLPEHRNSQLIPMSVS